jgi:RND family efflux transporter MFP subunit
MSIVTVPNRKKTPLLVGAAAAVIAVTAGAFALSRASHRSGEAAIQGASTHISDTRPVENAAGKVGDLQVTPDALELAEIKLVSANQRSVAEKLPVSGSIEPGGDRMVKVTPRVAGKVVTVSAVAGDAVRAGQTLATLESTELAQAQAAFRQAGSRVALAQNNLARQRKLAGLGVFGRPKVEEARKEGVAAQGDVNTTENELAAARNEVNEARSEKASLEGEVAAAESGVASARSEAKSGESEIAEAQAQVKTFQAALSQARTRVDTAQSRFNRYDTLLKEQLASRQDWEQARSDLEQSKADIDAAQANIAQAQAKVDTAKAHREAAQAQVQAAEAKVRAEGGRLQQAAAKIETAQARQAQVESRLAALKKRVQFTEQTLKREEAVYKGGYVTSREIVEAEAAVRQAQLEQQAAAQTVRLLGGSPGGGSTVVVVAPIAGRVQERKVSAGQTVSTDHELFTVINLDLVWAQLDVAPRDFRYMRPGQRVLLTSETAPGRIFTGTISALGNTADEKTRAVQVRVALMNRDGALRPETFVRGNIVTDVRQERVTVPTEALQDHQGKPTVYVATGDQPGDFEVRHVKLGVRGEGWREIADGLESGERIATGGTFYLKSEALKSSLSDGCCAPAK